MEEEDDNYHLQHRRRSRKANKILRAPNGTYANTSLVRTEDYEEIVN